MNNFDSFSQEIVALNQEYDQKQTFESKFVSALNRLEAFLAHNESPIETWSEKEQNMIF